MTARDLLFVWLFGSGLALYSVRRPGCLHTLFALVGLFLGIPGTLFQALLVGAVDFRYAEFTGSAAVGLYAGLAAIVVGTWLVFVLMDAWTLPRWLTRLLPVRGIHARGLLAGTALTGITGAGVAVTAVKAGPSLLPWHPAAGMVLVILGFVAYFAPLWSYLTTGPGEGEAADLPEGALVTDERMAR